MVKLNAATLLNNSEQSKYWLSKQLGTSYQNLDKMLNNETQSIRYENIETLCQLFKCTPNELFLFDEPPYDGFPLKVGIPELVKSKKEKQKQ